MKFARVTFWCRVKEKCVCKGTGSEVIRLQTKSIQ